MSIETLDRPSVNKSRIFSPKTAGPAEESDPIEIPDGKTPVDPFNPMLLPERLRPWIEDMAERAQCPIDYLAAPALVVAGSVLGCSVAIYPKLEDDWHEHPNLWGAIIGRPGTMKSPALKAVMEPLDQLGAAAITQWDTENEAFIRERMERKIRAEAAKAHALKDAKKNKAFDVAPMIEAELVMEGPSLRRFAVNDASYEALCERCRENPGGFLLYQDELMGLVRRAEDTPGMRELLLGGWGTLRNLTLDRIGRGRRHIPMVCLAILGSIQPGKLAPIIRGTLKGGEQSDGWLQRFSVMVWPDVSQEWKNVDRGPNPVARENAWKVFSDLANIGRDFEPGDQAGIAQYRFRPDALECFVEWHSKIEAVLRGGEWPEALEAHRSKYRKLIPAAALITELCDDPGATGVGLTSLQKAISWGEYLWSHAERVYGAAINPSFEAARLILKHLKKGDIAGEFSERDIYRKGWSGLTDPETVDKACTRLVDLHWFWEREECTGGRPSWLYHLTPKAANRLLSRGDDRHQI